MSISGKDSKGLLESAIARQRQFQTTEKLSNNEKCDNNDIILVKGDLSHKVAVSHETSYKLFF